MPKRILVADDSRTIRLAVAYTFQKEPNVELLLAPNGNAALDILRRESVDLLLLDYRMPDIDGTTLCARLKQEPQLAHIPILLMVGRGYDRTNASQFGEDGVIQKPFLSSNLIQRTASILHFAFEPSPLSIAEELRGVESDSIEIEIDFDTPAPAPPIQDNTPSPWGASSRSSSNTPFVPPDQVLPSFSAPPVRPPAQDLLPPSDGHVIDDLPYEAPLLPNPSVPSSPSAPPHSPMAPPLQRTPHNSSVRTNPSVLTTARISATDFSASANAGFPQESLSKSNPAPNDELEVFVGQAVEVPPTPRPNPPTPTPAPKPRSAPPHTTTSELLLPMEDEPRISQSSVLSSINPFSGQKKPEPPPLPSLSNFPPKKPPSSSGVLRKSPQETQKFQMVDLLKEENLASTSQKPGLPTPSLVSVNDFLPEGDDSSSNLLDDPLPTEKHRSPFTLRKEDSLQKAVKPKVVPPKEETSKAIPKLDTAFEMPFLEPSEKAVSTDLKITVPTTAHEDPIPDTDDDDAPYIDPTEHSSITVLQTSSAKDQVEFVLSHSLSLVEQTVVLHYLEHASKRIEAHIPEVLHTDVFVSCYRTPRGTIIVLGGPHIQVRLLSLCFLACWNNISEEALQRAEQRLIDSLDEKTKTSLQRPTMRVKVETKPFAKAVLSTHTALQSASIQQAISGLDAASSVLFNSTENTPLPKSTSDDTERLKLRDKLLEIPLHTLNEWLEDAFSISITQIAPLSLPNHALYLAVFYHFELRHQLIDLAEIIQEQQPSFDAQSFFDYPSA